MYGRSRAISEGGIGVTLTRELPKRAIGTLVFRLPGRTVDHSLQAELRYRSGFGTGFEFRWLVAKQREELRSLLRDHGRAAKTPGMIKPSHALGAPKAEKR